MLVDLYFFLSHFFVVLSFFFNFYFFTIIFCVIIYDKFIFLLAHNVANAMFLLCFENLLKEKTNKFALTKLGNDLNI